MSFHALCSAAGLEREEKVVELGSAAGIPWLEAEWEPIAFGVNEFSSEVCGIVEISSCVVGTGTGVLLVCAVGKC